MVVKGPTGLRTACVLPTHRLRIAYTLPDRSMKGGQLSKERRQCVNSIQVMFRLFRQYLTTPPG